MARTKHAPTPAVAALNAAGIPHTLHPYTHDPATDSYGLEAAQVLGVDPARVLKTLVVDTGGPGSGNGSTGALAVAVVPVAGHLDLKAVAAALGVKHVRMADPAAAQRATGYVVGGISPLGQRRRHRTLVDASALDHDTVLVSGGRRGLDVELAPTDLVRACDATVAAIAAP